MVNSWGNTVQAFFIFPVCFNWIKIVLSLIANPAATSEVVCDESASTMAHILHYLFWSPAVHGHLPASVLYPGYYIWSKYTLRQIKRA